MSTLRVLEAAALGLACLGMLLPVECMLAAPGAAGGQPIAVTDVALADGGKLRGQIVDTQGTPQRKLPVAVAQVDREVATTTTDDAGCFAVCGLHGGAHQIVAGTAQGVYRLWAPHTAPPSARPGVLLVVDGQPVRGQDGPLGYWLCHPWVLLGLAAVAVALPVAIHNHQSSRKPNSP